MRNDALDLRTHLRRLHRLGLYTIPGWGGGKLLPGTDPRALSLNPPSLREVLEADYSDGLIILAGTENPHGGYLVAIDVDHGPEIWPSMPKGFLYDELGTQNTKRHIFVRTTDRLEGVLNLVAYGTGELVAEIKGLNLSLRSWPTMPPDKPRGYQPASWTVEWNLLAGPELTARQLADGMADFLSRSLGESIWVKDLDRPKTPATGIVASGDLAAAVEHELDRRNVRLRRPGGTGWQLGFCPFHDNTKTPAFSVNLTQGWICFSTCGRGSIFNLARRLGISTPEVSRPRLRRRAHPSEHEPVAVSWRVRF